MAKQPNMDLPKIDPDELIIIGLDTDDGPEHELYDERVLLPIDENLIKNVMVYGVTQAVTVRQESGKYYVVTGRRRVRAARQAKARQGEAGEFEIKVPITDHGAKGADGIRLMGVMISENEQRQNDEVLTKAAKASRMLALGAHLDEVSISFGRSVTTIRQWLKLLEAHPNLHVAIRHGLIATSAANEVAKYPRDVQPQVLLELQKQAGEGNRISEAMAKAYRQANGDSTATSDTQAQATQAPSNENENENENDVPLSPEAQALLDATSGGPNIEPGSNLPVGGGTKAQPRQAGIKRTWLRKALKTERAKDLTEEQRGVLTWIAYGLSDAGSWYDDFQSDAQSEMEK